MKNLILIVLVALCLVGCISIGRGQDLEVENANTLAKDKKNNEKKASEIEEKLEKIIHESEDNIIVKTEDFFAGSSYIRKKDSYYCSYYKYHEYYFFDPSDDHIMYISYEQWKQLPSEKQKKFKKW